MKIFYCYGRVGGWGSSIILLFKMLVVFVPVLLNAQFQEEQYHKEEINAFLKVRLQLLIKKDQHNPQKTQRKVWRPVVRQEAKQELEQCKDQQEHFIGKVPDRWEQLCGLLSGKCCIPGVEVPRIIAVSGPKNVGKTLLIRDLVDSLQLPCWTTNLEALLLSPSYLVIFALQCNDAVEMNKEKSLVLHLDKCDQFCKQLYAQEKSVFVAILETILKRSHGKVTFILESQEPVASEIMAYVKSTLETIEVKSPDDNIKKLIWSKNLQQLKLPNDGADELASQFKRFNAQDIRQVTQRIARRCLVPQNNGKCSPYSFDKLLEEGNIYKEQSRQIYEAYIQ